MGALQSISTGATNAGPFGVVNPRDAWLEDRPGPGRDRVRSEILSLLDTQAQHHPLNHALAVSTGGQWRALTYSQLARRVRWMADDLAARFPQGGQPVAILAESGPAWGIAALATLASRNVLVPLDTSADTITLGAMLDQVGPAVLLASARYDDTVRKLTAAGASMGEFMPLGDPFVHVDFPIPCESDQSNLGGFAGAATDTAAVMAFTSGTTGEPKAVELSFDSLLYEVRALTRDFALRPSDRLLSVLPMHHMLEFTTGFLCPLWCGAEIYYLQSLLPGDALREIRSCGISRIVAVPAWLSLLKRELERREADRFPMCERTSTRLTAIRNHARQAFGPDLEHFLCGGAPLPVETGDYFEDLGVPVLQGYGLTETGPVVSVNTTRQARRGSVGRPLTGTETRIANDGEILVRGPQVASQYHLALGNRAPVADDDGWFHTGDLGHVDEDGFLYVTGRSKSTIVLASGKNVQPEEVEACLESRPEIEDVGVVGLSKGGSPNGVEEIGAVILASGAFAEYCRSKGQRASSALRRVVEEATRPLAPFKRPGRVIVSDQGLPRTATGKLRRSALVEWAMEQAATES